MKVYIDQSGKVEYTSKLTVVAFANGKSRTIAISAREKRKLLFVMKKMETGKPTYIYKIFSVLIFILLRGQRITEVIVDKEYPGHEGTIKNILKNLYEKNGLVLPNISFIEITKKSPAHKAAIEVYRKNKKADLTVKTEEVLGLFLTKKIGRRSHTR